MKMPNRLAATTTSYGAYGLEEALGGIAAAGYRHVELAAVDHLLEHLAHLAMCFDLFRDHPQYRVNVA